MNDNTFFSNTPFYFQIAWFLREKIKRGEYPPHTLLPSEPQLTAHYEVSRETVRKALSILVEEQLIYKRHGKGTYVNGELQRCECCGQVLPMGKQRKEAVQERTN